MNGEADVTMDRDGGMQRAEGRRGLAVVGMVRATDGLTGSRGGGGVARGGKAAGGGPVDGGLGLARGV